MYFARRFWHACRMAIEDKRLERLFEYTKWHIGIYLSVGGGLVGLLGSRDGNEFLKRVITQPALMGAALGAMALAGMAGGILASAATRSHSFVEVWDHVLEVYGVPTLKGRIWAGIEHSAFWLSLLLFALSILASRI